MLYDPELGLQGVLVTPPLYGAVATAYDSQQEYLRQHPHDTWTTSPLSVGLGLEIHYERDRQQASGIREYYGMPKLPEEKDNLQSKIGVALEPEDVEHIIESLQRQRRMLRYEARLLARTRIGFSVEGDEYRMARLVLALHDACMESQPGRVHLTPRRLGSTAIDYRLSELPT